MIGRKWKESKEKKKSIRAFHAFKSSLNSGVVERFQIVLGEKVNRVIVQFPVRGRASISRFFNWPLKKDRRIVHTGLYAIGREPGGLPIPIRGMIENCEEKLVAGSTKEEALEKLNVVAADLGIQFSLEPSSESTKALTSMPNAVSLKVQKRQTGRAYIGYVSSLVTFSGRDEFIIGNLQIWETFMKNVFEHAKPAIKDKYLEKNAVSSARAFIWASVGAAVGGAVGAWITATFG